MFDPAKSPRQNQQVDTDAEEDYKHTRREIRGGRYVDLTKDTQFSDAWIVLGILLSLVGIVLNNAFLTASAMVLFVIAAISRLWNDFSLFGLHYQRRFSHVRAFLGETIEITLDVRNQKFIPLPWLQITDAFPKLLPVDANDVQTPDEAIEADDLGNITEILPNEASSTGEFRTFWMLGPFQRLSRTYTIRCEHRGFHHFGPAIMNTGDGFGLFDRRASPSEQDRIIVYPRLYSAAELQLPAKNPFGEQATRRPLFEDPMRTVGIRAWQSADSPRRIHWKATARHQNLLSRIYEPSEEPQILICLNVATMPRYWQGVILEMLERAISVAGSLAAICTEQRLPVGLIANGVLPGSDQPLRLLPGRSHDQLVRILELLAAVQPLASGQIEKMIAEEAPRLPWGATLVVVSAVVTEALMAVLLTLDHAGRRIVLITLAEEAPIPIDMPSNILVYHLSHLVDDLIALHEV